MSTVAPAMGRPVSAFVTTPRIFPVQTGTSPKSTVADPVATCVMPPPVAVIVSPKEPVEASAAAVSLRNDVPSGVIGFSEKVLVTPLGSPLTLRSMGSLKPPMLPTPTAKLTELPGCSVWLEGEIVS